MNFFFLLLFSFISFVVLYFLLSSFIEKKLSSQKILEEQEAKINQLLVIMGDTVDQYVSLIEEKIKQLRSVTDLANRKINLLEKECHKLEQGHQTYYQLSKKRPLITSVIELKKDTTNEGSINDAEAINTTKFQHLGKFESKNSDPEKRKGVLEQIVQLSRETKSSSEIASLLGLALAEVEFTLSVHANKVNRKEF